MHRLFMNRANRDKAWAATGRRGIRSSIRNQNLHPMYVEDYPQVTGIALSKEDCGQGNVIYKTSFPVVYKLDDGNRRW